MLTANAELVTLNDKVAGMSVVSQPVAKKSDGQSELERDLELERKRVRDLQEVSRNQEKEYQKLKVLSRPFYYKRFDQLHLLIFLPDTNRQGQTPGPPCTSSTSQRERARTKHRNFI
jgi:hypothetical protein